VLALVVLVAVAPGSTGERVADVLRERGVNPELIVGLIAMLPIVELRGAVPVGILVLGLPWWKVVIWSLAGNLLPVVFLLFILKRLVRWLNRISVFRRFFDWLYARASNEGARIQRYEFWGLVAFVGIPLPGTGAWTGAVVAEVLRLPYWKSLLAIVGGVIAAATVVTLVSILGDRYRWFGYLLVAAMAAGLASAVFGLVRSRRD
jgi:uncharacterized membrane protein